MPSVQNDYAVTNLQKTSIKPADNSIPWEFGRIGEAATLPRFHGSINGIEIRILPDSGANISIINSKLKIQPKYTVPCNKSIRVANGAVMERKIAGIYDIEIGNGVKLKDIKLIQCHIQDDVILGTPVLWAEGFNMENNEIKLKNCVLNPIEYGQRVMCATDEETILQEESINYIYLENPASLKTTEPAINITTVKNGFLEEYELELQEGIYDNHEYIKIPIFNPFPFKITIPATVPLAYGETMEETAQGLECNELVEIKDESEQKRRFEEARELRQRKFKPGSSDAYQKVKIGKKLTQEQRQQMDKILRNNRWAFSTGDEDIGRIKGFQFAIKWKDETQEVYVPPRPIPPAYRDQARPIMTSWIEMKNIEPTTSKNNCPLFFIKKSGGTLRPVLDCRALNDQTIPNRYPIPHLRSLLQEVSELIGKTATKDLYITSTDVASAYNQLEIVKEDRHKCAFSYDNKHYQARRTLFGLRNAPSSWCEYMQRLTKGLKNTYCLLDDIIIVSDSWEEHCQTFEELCRRCIAEGLTLKPSKTFVGEEQIDYLGFHLSKSGILPMEHKMNPIRNYPQPTTRRELRRFLGMCNFYSHFVPKGHQVLSPLYKLCANGSGFRWSTQHRKAFEEYKKLLDATVKLSHRDPAKKLALVTDGSNLGIAAGLHQITAEGRLEPLGFVSRALVPAEKRFSSRYIELLAICWGLEQFRWYVTGYKTTIITDHFSLQQVMHEKEFKMQQPVRIINCLARLSRFEVEIIHRGNMSDEIIALDALSRAIPLPTENDIDEDDEKVDRGISNVIEVNALTRGMSKRKTPETPIIISDTQKQNTDNTGNTAAETEHEETPTLAPTRIRLKQYAFDKANQNALKIADMLYTNKQLMELQQADGRIAAKIKDGKCKINKDGLYTEPGKGWTADLLLIPECLARELISYMHLNGHLGADKLKEFLDRYFSIAKMRQICQEVCNQCDQCIICKSKPALRHPELPQADYTLTPWTRVYIDLSDFGRNTADDDGHRYVLGIMCAMTRFVDCIPLRNKQAKTVAQGLANLLLRYNAAGSKLVCDNGLENMANITQTLMKLFNISVSTISPYHAQSNKIERYWKELGIQAKIRSLDDNTWSRDLPILVFQLNNTPHMALGGLSPAEALTGRPLTLPCFTKLEIGDEDPCVFDWIEYINDWLPRIGEQLLTLQQQRMESTTTPKRNLDTLELGTKVAFWSPLKPQHSKKLFRSFGGAATISRILPGGAYEITDKFNRRLIRNICHLRRLPENTELCNFLESN